MPAAALWKRTDFFLISIGKNPARFPAEENAGTQHRPHFPRQPRRQLPDGAGDKYIGYEYIGENYSGNRKYILEYPTVTI